MKQAAGIIIGAMVIVGGGFLLFTNQTSNQMLSVTDGSSLTIATSFYPLQFALERIMGDLGTVTNIGAGRDPHDFSPSTQDMVTMQRADAVVLQGADFEPWGDDVQARLEADDVPVIIATAALKLHEGGHKHEEDTHTEDHGNEHEEEEHGHDDAHDAGHTDEHGADHAKADEHGHEQEHEAHADEHEAHADEDGHEHGSYDPHTWLDPVLFSQMVDYIAAEISVLDPDNAEVYRANADTLMAELAELHTTYENRLAQCVLSEVITSHDVLGYVGDRYGFTVHSIAGLSTQDTPSVTTLAQLRAEAAEGIGAILLEENSITAYGETLARETGLQTLSLNPIAHIIPAGENYLSLMQKNLDTFAIALQCNE